MQKRIAVVFVSLAALFAVSATARTQSPDPGVMIGTWKTNLAKSTYSPGPKPTVATTRKTETAPGGLFKTTTDGTNAQGQPTHTETVYGLDGKDNPVTGAQAPNTTAAYKRIDSRTFEVTNKVDGKQTTTTRVVISADGKTTTATQTGKNTEGQTVKNVIVADKQSD
jgi:hypothetical protein